MIIKNGIVFRDDMTFAKEDVYIENGKIVENLSQVSDTTEIDASNLYVLPGLVDIHSHGAVGYDFSDGNVEGLREILKYQYDHGITSYCPTSMTMEKEKLRQISLNLMMILSLSTIPTAKPAISYSPSL